MRKRRRRPSSKAAAVISEGRKDIREALAPKARRDHSRLKLAQASRLGRLYREALVSAARLRYFLRLPSAATPR